MPDTILPLELTAVRFETRGKRLIHDLDLVLDSGLRSIVLGPNGAGKSLLLRLCHGLIAPTAGRVRWAGLDDQAGGAGRVRWGGPGGQAGGAARRAQAMVFQHPILLRRSTAANVAYPLRLRGVGREERKHKVGAALDLAGLSALAERPARVLSGGEQQRLAIARAWVTRPEVLFLDEPTAHLDPAATRAVEQLIGAIHQAGTKIVMTTHDLGQARRLADEILFLHSGRLLERAPSDQFFAAPRSVEAARFLKGELVL